MLGLNALVTAAVSPLGMALLLGALAAMLAWLRFDRGTWLAATLAGLVLFLGASPWVSQALLAQVELGNPLVAPNDLPPAQAAVVLGGAMKPVARGYPLPRMNDSADRVWHAARLYKAGKVPLILLSGGSDPNISQSSEAAAMKQLLVELGVPAAALLLEEQSRTTRENARLSAEILRQRNIQHVLLVTSALHMPRAKGLFEAQGLKVTPAAIDHEAEDIGQWPAWQKWLPSAGALDASGRAIKEMVGRRVGA